MIKTVKLNWIPEGTYCTLKQVKHHLYLNKESDYCVTYKQQTGFYYWYDKLLISKLTWPIVHAEKVINNIDGRRFILDDRSDEIFLTNTDTVEVVKLDKNVSEINTYLYFPEQTFDNTPTVNISNFKILSLNTLIKKLTAFDIEIRLIVSTNKFVELSYKGRYKLIVHEDYHVDVEPKNEQMSKYFQHYVFRYITQYTDDIELTLVSKNTNNMQHKSQRLKVIDPVRFDFAESLLSGNRYSKICQKKFHPLVYTDKEAEELKLKPSVSVGKLPNLSKENEDYVWFKCDTKEAPYLGFITGEHPDDPDICLPCCRVRNPIDKPNQASCLNTGVSDEHRTKNFNNNGIIRKTYTDDEYFTIPDKALNSFLEQYGTFACYGNSAPIYGESYIVFYNQLDADISNYDHSKPVTTIIYKNLYNIGKLNNTTFTKEFQSTEELLKDIKYYFIDKSSNNLTADIYNAGYLTYNQLYYLVQNKIEYSFGKKINTYIFKDIIHTIYDDDSIIAAVVSFVYKSKSPLQYLYLPLSYQKTDGPSNTILKECVDQLTPWNAIVYSYNIPDVINREWISNGDNVFALRYTTVDRISKYIYFKEYKSTHEVFEKIPIVNVGFSYYDSQEHIYTVSEVKPLKTKHAYYWNLYTLFIKHYNDFYSTQRNKTARANIKYIDNLTVTLYEPAIFPYNINMELTQQDSYKFLSIYQLDLDINDIQFNFDAINPNLDDIVEFTDKDFIEYTDEYELCRSYDNEHKPFYCTKKNKLIIPSKDIKFVLQIIDRLL